MTASPEGCGVLEHAESCLCDVVITKPLLPLEDCMTDAIRSMWMADVMCEVRGYCQPWTNEKILDFLVDMEKFYDAWHETRYSIGGAEQLSQMAPLELFDDLTPMQRWRGVRDAVALAIDKFPCETLEDIVRQLQLRPQDVVDAMTTGKSGDLPWDYERLQQLDNLFSEQYISFADIARKINMTEYSVRNLSKYWETKRKYLWGSVHSETPHRNMLYHLCLETDLPNKEIISKIEQKYNHKYHKSTITRIRQRNNHGTLEE